MLRKEKRKREGSRKRRFVTLATLLLTAAVAAVVAWYSWPSSEPLANVIAGDGSNTIRRVTAQHTN